MAKVKFKYNPESLSFDKIKLSFWDKTVRFFTYFLASVLLAILYAVVFTLLFDSPKEKALIRENDQLILQYDVMNRKLATVEKVLEELQERDDNIYR